MFGTFAFLRGINATGRRFLLVDVKNIKAKTG